MADREQLDLIKREVEDWNRWRRRIPEVSPDLSGADLSGAVLSGADLSRTDLSATNLSWADLLKANLSDANLSATNLSWANLEWANLNGADLRRTDLSKACLADTIFGNTNLTDATGLETCNHIGPSTLDFSTVAKSGPLPLKFLQGCGLPDSLIAYLPSLLTEAVQFYTCFISYSTKDETFAQQFHGDLQNNGVRCWFAPHDIRGGKKLHEQIDEAIRVYDRLLLVISEHSMNSEWVRTEIAKARKRELREKRRMLFPVRLVDFERLREWECFDADTGKDSAREIREYFIPDFTNWKDFYSYQKALQRVLVDLKDDTAEMGPTALNTPAIG